MLVRVIRKTLVVAAVAAAAWLAQPGEEAQAIEPARPRYDLFYNYYVPPSQQGGVGAQLYLSPRPTPAYVGHTWYTYQPLYPHEFMYPHCRVYRRYDDRHLLPRNRTTVLYW